MKRTANIEHLEKGKYYDATFKCDCSGGHSTWQAIVRVDGLSLNTPATAELMIVDTDEGAVQAGFSFAIYESDSRWAYGPHRDPITFKTVASPSEPEETEATQVAAARLHSLYGSRIDHNPVLGYEQLLQKYSAGDYGNVPYADPGLSKNDPGKEKFPIDPKHIAPAERYIDEPSVKKEYSPKNYQEVKHNIEDAAGKESSVKRADLLPKEPCPKCGAQLVVVTYPFHGVECSMKDTGNCDFEQKDDENNGSDTQLKAPLHREDLGRAFGVGASRLSYIEEEDGNTNVGETTPGSELPDPRYSADGAMEQSAVTDDSNSSLNDNADGGGNQNAPQMNYPRASKEAEIVQGPWGSADEKPKPKRNHPSNPDWEPDEGPSRDEAMAMHPSNPKWKQRGLSVVTQRIIRRARTGIAADRPSDEAMAHIKHLSGPGHNINPEQLMHQHEQNTKSYQKQGIEPDSLDDYVKGMHDYHHGVGVRNHQTPDQGLADPEEYNLQGKFTPHTHEQHSEGPFVHKVSRRVEAVRPLQRPLNKPIKKPLAPGDTEYIPPKKQEQPQVIQPPAPPKSKPNAPMNLPPADPKKPFNKNEKPQPPTNPLEEHEKIVRQVKQRGPFKASRVIRRAAGPKRIVPKDPAQKSEPNPAVTEETSLIPDQGTKTKTWKEKSLLPGHERGQRKDPNNKIPRNRKHSTATEVSAPRNGDTDQLNFAPTTTGEAIGRTPVVKNNDAVHTGFTTYDDYSWENIHEAAMAQTQVCPECGNVSDPDDDDGTTFDADGLPDDVCAACGAPLTQDSHMPYDGSDEPNDEETEGDERKSDEPDFPNSLPSLASIHKESMEDFFGDDSGGGSASDDEMHRFMMANLSTLIAGGGVPTEQVDDRSSVPLTTLGPEWSENVEPTNDDGSYGRPRVTSSASADTYIDLL